MTERPITIDHNDLRLAVRFTTATVCRDLRELRFYPNVPGNASREAVIAAHPCPFGEAGATLWVRERTAKEDDGGLRYSGDVDLLGSSDWRPISKMSRRVARVFLRVRSTRLEHMGTSAGWWQWTADVEVCRDREGRLCPPGPEAVWRGAFNQAVMWAGLDDAADIVRTTLTPLLADAAQHEEARAVLWTYLRTWPVCVMPYLVTRVVLELVKPHRGRVAGKVLWAALVAKERHEVRG